MDLQVILRIKILAMELLSIAEAISKNTHKKTLVSILGGGYASSN